MDMIRDIAAGKALEWATALSQGKPMHEAVPYNPVSAIRGALNNIANNDAVTEVRKAKAAKAYGGKSDNVRGTAVRI
ncbi:hypothetical protein [uncultured Paracoccus sp.]|uniref:hypothetical protein n=1 Tax=uncultured Paracoccus sp. TaxID=189685 RepID=UPI0026391251|nr:hypothetical protein [uncultured Paracoccus sp.]